MEFLTIGEAIHKYTQSRYRAREGTELTVEAIKKEFDYIQPTERELALGMIKSIELAIQRLEEEEKKKKKEAEYIEAKRMWSYEEMRLVALERAKIIGQQENFEFQWDDNNVHAFHLLCLFFTNDPEFENYDFGGVKYSLKKGIWLQSPVRGTGKTCLLRLFQENKRSCFHYLNIDWLRAAYQGSGIHEVVRRGKVAECTPTKGNFFQDGKGFMYDEFFGEDKVLHMGSPLLISEFIINSIYDFQKVRDFSRFHITSNFDGEAIEKKSGASYRSRMVEMFNLIKLEGMDRRKKQ